MLGGGSGETVDTRLGVVGMTASMGRSKIYCGRTMRQNTLMRR